MAPGVIAGSGSPGTRTDAPGVAAGVGFALSFAVGRGVTFGAIVLGAGRVGPAGGVSVGVTSSVGLGASVSAGAVGVVTAAGTRVPTLVGVGAVAAQPATIVAIRVTRATNGWLRSTRALWLPFTRGSVPRLPERTQGPSGPRTPVALPPGNVGVNRERSARCGAGGQDQTDAMLLSPAHLPGLEQLH